MHFIHDVFFALHTSMVNGYTFGRNTSHIVSWDIGLRLKIKWKIERNIEIVLRQM